MMTSDAVKKTRAPKVHPYYNFDKLYSYNAVFNFVMGARGLGKTYGAKKKAIQAALERGEQFILLRRYKPELAARHTFFDDLVAKDEFPEWDFRINGDRAEASGVEFRDEKKRQWITLGFFVALVVAQNKKGTPYPNVRTIIFDEFIIEKGAVHYLPDEPTVMQNFYNTVDRYQDKTRVLFLANAVSISNPYFIRYNINEHITPGTDYEWIRLAEGFVVCHFAKSSDYAASVRQTRFGRFAQQYTPEYDNYAVGNTFADNNDSLLQFKDEQARYIYTLHLKSGDVSIWHNGFSGNFYAQQRLPKRQKHFTIDPELMREGRRLLVKSDKLLQYLRTAFRNGNLTFDSPQTRNSMMHIFDS